MPVEFDPPPCFINPIRDCLMFCPNREVSELSLLQLIKDSGFSNEEQAKTFLRTNLYGLPPEEAEKLILGQFHQLVESGEQPETCIAYSELMDLA